MLEQPRLQEAFHGFNLTVGGNGTCVTRLIGRRRILQEEKSTEAPEAHIKGPSSTVTINTNEFRAQLADIEAGDLKAEADKKIRMVGELNYELTYYEAQLKKFRRRRKFAKKAIPAQTIGFGAIGFFLGVLLAISELLTDHGPTVTLFGTLGACALYLLGGLIFAAVFLWLGREQGIAFVQDYSAKIRSHMAIAKEIRDEIATLQAEANALAEQARAKHREAWRCRGLI